ncbi:MAG: tetratricopeptide repeat protein [Armatimonadetes bacterium]|nr:tetratricopeptide repeat protein [Armatimonadota bacterium]
MRPLQLFHFTPSLMSPETLEDLFVRREPLAQRLTALIRESALTQNKHHTLLIGPRGIGKTHMVALVYYRIRAMADLRDRLRVAWLREEEWGVESFLDLLLRICRALQEEYPDTFPADRVESLYQQESGAAQRLAERLLQEFVGGRTLLLLVENLDDLFKGIGDKGQRQLRAFIQETSFSTILATSQSLFNGVSRQTAPFYGFFRVQHLPEFTVEDAILLLKNIAHLREDPPLAAFIDTPSGRARVRTVNHLAGGNPRVYVIFSEFLTRESLDELVEPFMKTLDELTPYYQARMSHLSVQQRKIVEFLCDRGAAATVKEIARRCFITSQTASSQLKELKEKGYVHADPLGPTGRDTYYELREPLMRMSLEVKKSRSGPIRLIVDFLRLWYPVTELRHQLDTCKPEARLEREYLTQAIKVAEESPDPRVRECRKAFNDYVSRQLFMEAMGVANELVALQSDATSYSDRGFCLIALGRTEEALRDFETALEKDASHTEAWTNRGAALVCLGQYEEALASLNRVAELDPNTAIIWIGMATTYEGLGQLDQALRALDEAIKIGFREFKTAKSEEEYAWIKRGKLLTRLTRYGEALASLENATQVSPCSEEAWLERARVLFRMERLEEAASCCDEAVKCNPASWYAWYNKGQLFAAQKRYMEAVDCYNRAIEHDSKVDCPHLDRVQAFFELRRFAEGFVSLADALERFTGRPEHLVNHTIPLVKSLFTCASHDEWGQYAGALVELYSKHDAAVVLAVALGGSVSYVLLPDVSRTLIDNWYGAWKSATEHLPVFEAPLRLMDAAIRYNDTQDKRVLLELPAEERKILEGLLKPEEKDRGEDIGER